MMIGCISEVDVCMTHI